MLKLSQASARALELPELLEVLAGLAATDLGAARIRDLSPGTDPSALDRWRRLVLEVEDLLARGGTVVPSADEPLAPLLDRLATADEAPSGRELLRLAGLLATGQGAMERITAESDRFPELVAVAPAASGTRPLVTRIQRLLDRRGELREDATPRLAASRRRIRDLRDRLYESLRASVDRHRDELAEETIPLRNGRLVLLLKAGARGRLEGISHGRSSSGQSFYFEPLTAVESNNRLGQAIEDEELERRRIMAELATEVATAWPEIIRVVEFLTTLEVAQALCRWTDLIDARWVETGVEGELLLKSARHPLLDPRLAELRRQALGAGGHDGEVVALDVALDPEHRVLVVTGPNAGGKTVALKTVGLLAVLHYCGVPLPVAAGSRMPPIETVVATVGDDQDLLADRSTFSGRLLRLGEAWAEAGPRTLVLLDELGSGTDPEEGGALAVALLEELVERRALAVVTTHLLAVASTGFSNLGADSAAMEFDHASGRPTFHLRRGAPGGSEALALAERLDLPAPWLGRARQLLSPDHRALNRLLAEVEEERRVVGSERSALEQRTRELGEAQQRLEELKRDLERERQELGERFGAKLTSFREKVEERLNAEVRRIADQAASGRRRGLAAEASRRLFVDAPVFVPQPEAGPLEIGALVRHRGQGWEGRLEAIDRGVASVRVGGKRLQCSPEDLIPAVEKPSAPRRRPRVEISSSEVADAPRELDLHGERVEEALEHLDQFLDRALLASYAEVRIVHGHGTGRLRRAVRDMLGRHVAVSAFRPGGSSEGGDGVTVVRLGSL